MNRDQYGLEMTAASADAVDRYDAMILHYLGLRQDTGERLKEVFEADAEMPMAYCARGYFMKLFCTPPLERKAEENLAEAQRLIAPGASRPRKTACRRAAALVRGRHPGRHRHLGIDPARPSARYPGPTAGAFYPFLSG